MEKRLYEIHFIEIIYAGGRMGFLKRLQKSYEDYELENLEDLVYDDPDYKEEQPKKKKRNVNTKPRTNMAADDETEKKRQETMKEEEKYDHLLNSVQAQDLIKTVDKISNGERKQDSPVEVVEFFEEKKVEIPDVNRKPKKLETVNLDRFKGQDVENYVKEQCDIMEEAAAYIETARQEYESVTEHFSDVQIIENAPEPLRDQISAAAEMVDSLTIDRRIFKASEQKLSNNTYHNVEMYENEIPKALEYLEQQEVFFQAVQRDMRMLEGERLGLRMESKLLVKRQLNIRKMALGFIFCIIAVFVVFFAAMAIMGSDENMMLLLLVTGLAAVFALFMFAMLKTTERQVLVTEIKLNKATSLLNKAKIKYINSANTLDYEYNKYHIKSAYELRKKYETYKQMKSEQAKIIRLTSNLNDAEIALEQLLRQLGLYDVRIWLGQVRALFNPKEMVEVRHDLSVQRQKLRNQIEYNEKRIEEAKENIKEITVKNPEYSTFALRIIELYERKNRSKRSLE